MRVLGVKTGGGDRGFQGGGRGVKIGLNRVKKGQKGPFTYRLEGAPRTGGSKRGHFRGILGG